MADLRQAAITFVSRGRRYTLKAQTDPGRVSFRDVTASRTGLALTPNQRRIAEKLFADLVRILDGAELPLPDPPR